MMQLRRPLSLDSLKANSSKANATTVASTGIKDRIAQTRKTVVEMGLVSMANATGAGKWATRRLIAERRRPAIQK